MSWQDLLRCRSWLNFDAQFADWIISPMQLTDVMADCLNLPRMIDTFKVHIDLYVVSV